MSVCKSPQGIAIIGTTAWLTCYDAGTIEPLDLTTKKVGTPVAAPGGPYAIALVSRPQ
jgi:hypothetical protein